MSPVANNDEALLIMFKGVFGQITDEIADWVLQQIKMSVEQNVYVYPESEFYDRLGENGGLLGAWKKEVTRIIGNYIEAQVGFDETALEYNPDQHQHGNMSEDRRERIPKLVETGREYDFGGNASIPRPFWNIIEDMFNDGTIDTVFENKMTRYGIQFIKNL